MRYEYTERVVGWYVDDSRQRRGFYREEPARRFFDEHHDALEWGELIEVSDGSTDRPRRRSQVLERRDPCPFSMGDKFGNDAAVAPAFEHQQRGEGC